MARNGLILWENGATGSRKVFRYLRGLRDTIKNTKLIAKVQQLKNTVYHIPFEKLDHAPDKWKVKYSGKNSIIHIQKLFKIKKVIKKLKMLLYPIMFMV